MEGKNCHTPCSFFCRCLVILGAAIFTLCFPPLAPAEFSEDVRDEQADRPDGIHVLDGSYVLNMGQFHVNITNHGLIGSQYSSTFPWSVASSGEWPGGSGHNGQEVVSGIYLYTVRSDDQRFEDFRGRFVVIR